jgi:PAS domain S-box-containing protein
MNEKNKSKKTIINKLQELVKQNSSSPSVDFSSYESDILKLTHELQVHHVELELQNQELKVAETSLSESLEKYRHLAESSTSIVYRLLLKPTLKFDYISPSATVITGYTPEDHYADPMLGFKLVHPDDRVLLESTTKHSKGEPLELRWIRKDGQVIWTEQRNVLIFDENNEPFAIEGNARDITDRKKAEEIIRKSEEKFRIVADNAFNWEFWEGPDGKAIHHSPSCKKMTGYSADEFMKDDELLTKIIHPDDRETYAKHHQEMEANPSPGRLLFRIIHSNGEIRHIEHLCQPVFDSAHNYIGIRGSHIDITERSLIEDAQTFLLGCGLPGTGEDFFESLARYLARTLNMEYVCIDRLEGDGLTAQTVAIYNEGIFESNVRYSLRDTPCGEVVDKSVCLYRRGVRHLFPNDAALQDLHAESYAGTTLLDSKGNAIGLIAVIGHKPLHEEAKAQTLLKLVASRAAGELERRQAENALKETVEQLYLAKKKAEESDRLKSAFLANMSHEIRTPMNGILGFSNLLNEPNLGIKEQQEYIRVIQKSGTRMLNIINDIIDISKIESGTVETKISKVDIKALIEYVVKLLEPEAKSKKLSLFIKLPYPGPQRMMMTDGDKVYSIISNLVKNAIKYTNTGYINIGYHDMEGEIEFFVKDTGIGIHQERKEAIFDRFVQADIEDIQARQGAGLGLSISKAYVAMLGGKIWVESEPDHGSTFYFSLPETADQAPGDTEATKAAHIK